VSAAPVPPMIPMILVIVPVEGEAVARILSATYEEELRVALDVWNRDTILQVGAAIARLRAELEERERQR
jgi:hypothetical protein